MGFGARYKSFDRFQQRHRLLGYPLAVFQKYSDDEGSSLAATISYYGFFSIFPLLLVFTTVLGYVLDQNGDLYKSLLDSALGQFPVIGRQLQTHSLRGSGLALGLGIAAALWAGMWASSSLRRRRWTRSGGCRTPTDPTSSARVLGRSACFSCWAAACW